MRWVCSRCSALATRAGTEDRFRSNRTAPSARRPGIRRWRRRVPCRARARAGGRLLIAPSPWPAPMPTSRRRRASRRRRRAGRPRIDPHGGEPCRRAGSAFPRMPRGLSNRYARQEPWSDGEEPAHPVSPGRRPPRSSLAIATPAAECAPARARHMSCWVSPTRTAPGGCGFAGGSSARRPGLRRRPRQRNDRPAYRGARRSCSRRVQ